MILLLLSSLLPVVLDMLELLLQSLQVVVLVEMLYSQLVLASMVELVLLMVVLPLVMVMVVLYVTVVRCFHLYGTVSTPQELSPSHQRAT